MLAPSRLRTICELTPCLAGGFTSITQGSAPASFSSIRTFPLAVTCTSARIVLSVLLWIRVWNDIVCFKLIWAFASSCLLLCIYVPFISVLKIWLTTQAVWAWSWPCMCTCAACACVCVHAYTYWHVCTCACMYVFVCVNLRLCVLSIMCIAAVSSFSS